MSLKITSIVREKPAPCNHFVLTVNDNGNIRTTKISMPDIMSMFDQFPGGTRGALLLSWARDRLDRGATPAQCVNVEVESVI